MSSHTLGSLSTFMFCTLREFRTEDCPHEYLSFIESFFEKTPPPSTSRRMRIEGCRQAHAHPHSNQQRETNLQKCTFTHSENGATSNVTIVSFHIYLTCRMLLDYIFNRSNLLLASIHFCPSKQKSFHLNFLFTSWKNPP